MSPALSSTQMLFQQHQKELWEKAKNQLSGQIMTHLYTTAFDHWNDLLQKFAKKNTRLHGRTGMYAVHFNGQRYLPISLNYREDRPNNFCLILHPDHPDLVEEMELIADRFDQLRKERYAVSRFLQGLFALGINYDQFGTILGDDVRAACSATYINAVIDCSGEVRLAQQAGIERYVKQNQDIIDMIGERRLINLVAGG